MRLGRSGSQRATGCLAAARWASSFCPAVARAAGCRRASRMWGCRAGSCQFRCSASASCGCRASSIVPRGGTGRRCRPGSLARSHCTSSPTPASRITSRRSCARTTISAFPRPRCSSALRKIHRCSTVGDSYPTTPTWTSAGTAPAQVVRSRLSSMQAPWPMPRVEAWSGSTSWVARTSSPGWRTPSSWASRKPWAWRWQ
mmetsp:Transcript_34111/g.98339  ORF Transcript_34111/g.98339 Transcript_34111/m.98339 type:complete len:200 (-) Transcript_34111:868-1467(-)